MVGVALLLPPVARLVEPSDDYAVLPRQVVAFSGPTVVLKWVAQHEQTHSKGCYGFFG